MKPTCSSWRTAPDTAGWLIRKDSASSADVIVPVGLTSIRPITRADIVGTPLSAAFQQSVASYLGRSYSIVNLSDEAAMPVAMTAFGAFISLTSIPLACAVIGTAFAALMIWSALRVSN
jgi:hypothetical protein